MIRGDRYKIQLKTVCILMIIDTRQVCFMAFYQTLKSHIIEQIALRTFLTDNPNYRQLKDKINQLIYKEE